MPSPSPDEVPDLRGEVRPGEAASRGFADASTDPDMALPSIEERTHLCNRLRLELRQRWERGDRVLVEEYLTAWPSLNSDPDGAMDLIYSEITLREELGETPRQDEYQRRFPHLSDQLQRQFQLHEALQAGSLWSDPSVNQPAAAVPNTLSFVGEKTDDSSEHTLPGPGPRTGPAGEAVKVPGYEVFHELGRGGMGVVYLARHLGLKRLVALKMLLSGAHSGSGERARFFREAERVARLQHPHIVQVHDVGSHDGKPFITLEYVEGGSLAQKIAGKPQPPHEAARLIEVLARAVAHAHARNIIHRDLKPANVLLTPDGLPKVTDFGLSKDLDLDTGRTASGAILGTPSYMAPEQALGKAKSVGPAADVYALGAILYELLTGKAPFVGETMLETLDLVRRKPPAPPRKLQPGIPVALETICLSCLAKNPARRYASAGDLADDLRRYLDGQSIVQRRPRRRLHLAAVMTAVLVPALALAGWLGWRRPSLPPASHQLGQQVKVLLQDNCAACHGPDLAQPQGKLNLFDPAQLLDTRRHIVVPGNPGASLLIQRVAEQDDLKWKMPPAPYHRLDEADRQLLEQWVAGGAPLPDDFGEPPPSRPGQRFALLIAVRDYKLMELETVFQYTERDVEELAHELRDGGFPRENLLLLTQWTEADNPKRAPTADNIRMQLTRLLLRLRPDDQVFVVLAGQGLQRGDMYYYIPAGARPDDPSTLISLAEIYSAFASCRAASKLLLVDTGRVLSDLAALPTADAALRPPRGSATFFSCAAGRNALEPSRLKHGLFSYFLLKGLHGDADRNADGTIDLDELALFTGDGMREYQLDDPDIGVVFQVPELISNLGGPLPVVERRPGS